MKIVYAVTTANVAVDGNHASVIYGTHWPASDPVVKKYPTLFSDDPRYGLFSTVPLVDDAPEEDPAQVDDAPEEDPAQSYTSATDGLPREFSHPDAAPAAKGKDEEPPAVTPRRGPGRPPKTRD